MRALASFIMRGRMQAILVAVVGAVLSLVIPPLNHIAGAAIGLVTLRNGGREGFFLVIALGLVMGAIGSFSNLDGGLVQIYVIGMVLLSIPILIAAMVLRATRALDLTLIVIAAFTALLVVLANIMIGDAAAWWRAVLDGVLGPAMEQAQVPPEQMEQMLNDTARMMTGLIGAVLLYSTMINLSLARWFQAMLYNPGGFQQEFHALYLDRRVAIVAALIGAVGMVFAGQGGIPQDLMILVVALFSIHGLALVHGLIGLTNMGRGWLIALYIGLLLVPPHIAMMLAMIGYIDSWSDIRGRVRKKLAGRRPPKDDDFDDHDGGTPPDDHEDGREKVRVEVKRDDERRQRY